MTNLRMRGWLLHILPVLVGSLLGGSIAAQTQLDWSITQNRVSADIKSQDLQKLLEQIATATGWEVYLERGTTRETSAKFKDLPPGDALRLLLGNLNFALVPQTNAGSRLYVFRTSRGNATQLIRPAPSKVGGRNSGVIPNELILRLKPGVKIEDVARRLGAKITGRIDALNTYRLEFTDEAAAQAARELALKDPDVTGIDSNYSVDRPPLPQILPNSYQPNWNLKPQDSSGSCQVTVGLIDTSVGPLGYGLDSFLLPSVSIAGAPGATPTELTHGTAMAEAILQGIQTNIPGNKTAVKILPVDVYGAHSTTTTFDVGQGIYQAVNSGANLINLSLGGGGDSTFLHNLISSASQQGVVFFGAAGNEPVTTATYPAAYPEVIAVTASDPNGQIASYANRGSFVAIMAPGTSVAAYQGQAYIVTGTSSATAFASGFAAALADRSQDCPSQVISTVRSRWGVNLGPGP
jgi:hypothetical protein